MHDDLNRLPDVLRRPLDPPAGGAERLARALRALRADAARETSRGVASGARLRPGFAFAGVAALALAGALPMRTVIEDRRERAAFEARLATAIAEAGQPLPDVRIDGATIEALPSTTPGVRLYRVDRAGP